MDESNTRIPTEENIREDYSFMTIENSANSCMAKAIIEYEKVLGINGEDGLPAESDETNEDTSIYAGLPRSIDFTTESAGACNSCGRIQSGTLTPVVEMTANDDWQSHLITPHQRLTQLFTMGHLTDVTIQFAEYGAVYKAHRLILATASPVFERMLYGGSMESVTGLIRLHGCHPRAIKWLLNNLYLGKSNLPDVDTAIDIYDLSQMYQISGIADLCADYLKFSVSLSNLPEVFQIALTHSEKCLIDVCLKKLCSKWPDMLDEHISNLTEDLWLFILKRDVLNTDEVQLFTGLYIWNKSRLEKANEPVTPNAIRKGMAKFLPYMRLLAIPPDKFIDFVMPTDVFTHNECSSILRSQRGSETSLMSSVNCSLIRYGRVEITDQTLKSVVLNRTSSCRKSHPTIVTEVVLIRDLTLTSPILLSKIETHDNSTLKTSQLTVQDMSGQEIGVAKALGAHWKFVNPVYLYANKAYSVHIDKALVNKALTLRSICSYTNDIKIKGTTGDNFIKFLYWPVT